MSFGTGTERHRSVPYLWITTPWLWTAPRTIGSRGFLSFKERRPNPISDHIFAVLILSTTTRQFSNEIMSMCTIFCIFFFPTKLSELAYQRNGHCPPRDKFLKLVWYIYFHFISNAETFCSSQEILWLSLFLENSIFTSSIVFLTHTHIAKNRKVYKILRKIIEWLRNAPVSTITYVLTKVKIN